MKGGPWGMAIIAQFFVDKQVNESLSDYLTIMPSKIRKAQR